jgi:hypothetical protein
MIEKAIQQLRRLGSRAEARAETLGSCPVCGEGVKRSDEPMRAWAGKYAHRECAGYVRRPRRGRNSQRIHNRFTAA